MPTTPSLIATAATLAASSLLNIATAALPELDPNHIHAPTPAAEPDAVERFNIDNPFDHAAAARIFNPDRRIDATRTFPASYHLDFHAPTGAYFVVASWDDGWGVYRSTNNGLTWTNTYFFNASATPPDVDLVATDDWVYIAYGVNTIGSEDWARLRRVNAFTGLVDNDFGFQIVFAEDGNPVKEVELAADTDDDGLAQGLLYTALYNDGSIRYAFGNVNDGTTFTEIPTGITNANRHLNFHYNANRTTNRFAFLSYVNINNDIELYARGGGTGWDQRELVSNITTSPSHGMTAEADLVMLSFVDTFSEARYRVSYNAGDSWASAGNNASLQSDAFPTNTDVTARLGYGTARATAVELGDDDSIIVDIRQSYTQGAWRSSLDPEDNDVLTLLGVNIDIEALPIDSPIDQYRYGIIWRAEDDTLRFDRIDGCPGDTNGDRIVNALDISNVLGNFGAATPTPYNGDLNGSGNVTPTDISIVLGNFGNTCPE